VTGVLLIGRLLLIAATTVAGFLLAPSMELPPAAHGPMR